MSNKIQIDFWKLESLIHKLGYKINCQPFKNKNEANHTRKIITTWCQIDDKENILLTHEIGHIYLWKIEKYFRYINELLAWIIGYIICKRNNIDTKDFRKIKRECLDTYKESYFKRGE
jgi:hypothetical protein